MSSELKVLQVIPKLGYGGAETGCYDLAHYLPENNCSSYIVTSGGELLKFIDKKKVKVIKLPVHSKNPFLMLFNSIALIFIILLNNISIVHARSRAPAWSCLFATKITRRKFVTTFHGTYNFKNSIKKFYNSVMVRSDLIIAGSNFIFSHINQNYSKYLDLKKKFLVIFRGINVDYFELSTILDSEENRLISDWEVDRNKKTILMPGRLTAWKGQETFIEALNLVNKELGYESFNAIILGSDQGRDIYTKKIKRLAEQYRLTSQLKFIEHCKNMPLAYKISDIVVSASVEPEAFGRVAVEAQSMEKPIIASDIGGSNETIIDNVTGFLFQSGNAEALSKKIIEVLQLDESRLKSIGIEGRKNIIKKFNVEKMCFSTYSEYKKLLN
ncbi:glycosyltransferase family 4 protein [Candidatus Pelagibacter ubique]|jgi:glycosyltransferase involved in cell wall biosynthesis|uniref:glycosyltransferase family 4 protein n=1 Tax=Pelagibacter ubique TaxID=198252 RepID=UPI002302A355|nr:MULTISPECIES: glycosyltransferase family 4 protein [Pelagibacter]MDA7443588.1 glycosyltransferase family 4 protein [Candidatus Pelagibacter ubique]MDA7445511.1 glycosyltransferase family 4 protein [Candidatus Pelagibacter ubique]MDA7476373.1 glycosyltransferase family 4 protein [Candidatus Pelagibacter ubique]MDA8841200.1 glycosyltransferase family 4 protein [Candidatus Pelagibacter bacterium]MDB9768288.1 glycosyltransferase family 4 protein [Candidatus Pelagibacter ubique]